MTQLIDLNGIRLNELQTNPALYPSTYFLIQNGTDKAENSTIALLENYLDINLKISSAVDTHTNASDPHGDRAYNTALLNNHTSLDNAHGHKTYTDNTVIVHTQGLDPHGDRLFATQLMNTHNALTDPHGHKAYANSQIATHNADTSAHGIQTSINTTINSLRGTLNGFAPLDSNEKIPTNYLPTSNVSTIFVFVLPATGVSNVVYVNMTDNNQYFWTGSSFQKLSSYNIGSASLTTDNVAESTTDLNKRYFSTLRQATLENSINLRLNNAISLGTEPTRGNVFKEKIGSTIYLRSIVAGDGIIVAETTTGITISKEPESVIESEPTEFTLQTRTYPGTLTGTMTLDGDPLDTVTYINTLSVPENGLTFFEGRVVVSKVKQGSGLAQAGKYNATEEVRTWQVKLLISSYTNWTALQDPTQVVSILSSEITEDMIVGSSNTSAIINPSVVAADKAVLIGVQSNNDLNYVYLWKGTFKKTSLRHESTGTIDHAF